MDTRRRIRSREPEPPRKSPPVRVAPVWLAVSRAVACFIGMTLLLFLFVEIKQKGPGAPIWWLNALPVKPELIWGFLALTGFEFLGFFLLPRMSFARRWLTFTLTMILFSGALRESYFYYQMLKSKQILSDFPIPFSLHVAASLTIIIPGLFVSYDEQGSAFRNFVTICATISICLISFPLSLIYCAGHINNQQETEWALITGSTTSSGESSLIQIKNRVETGVELYRNGKFHKFCFASGEMIEEKTEARIMKDHAIELGVDPNDIVTEDQSHSFRETIEATTNLFKEKDIKTIRLINEFEPIARTRLAFERYGILVLTTPVKDEENKEISFKAIQKEIQGILKFFYRPLE